MQTSYTYSIFSDTPNNKADLSSLEYEIFLSATDSNDPITTTLLGTQINGDNLIITFAASLSAEEVSKLNAIVSTHAGNPRNVPETVSLNLPTTADGTLQTSKQQLDLGRLAFKRIDSQSEKMNIDGSESGNISNIFNGTENPIDWVISGIGSVTEESGRDGYGYDSGITTLINQSISFDSEITQSLTNFDLLEFYIQIKTLPLLSKIRVSWKDGYSNTIGVTLDVEHYISNLDFDEWKKVTIPITDFGLGDSEVQILNFSLEGAVGSRVWLDNIDLVSQAPGPYIFRVSAPTNEIYNIEKIVLSISAPDSGWNSSSFGNIANGLENGLLFRYRMIDGYTFWSFNCRNNMELFGQLSVLNNINFNDAELTVIFALEPNLSSVILVDDDEVIEMVVRDDLSSLTNMRAYLHYGVERIPQ